MAAEAKCMYIGCNNYSPNATRFCCNGCMWDEEDRASLYREEDRSAFKRKAKEDAKVKRNSRVDRTFL